LIDRLVAQRYARAFLLNIDPQQYVSIREDITLLSSIFATDKEYVISLNSFLYPLKERLLLADRVAEKLQNSSVWKNLFNILIKKHRFTVITAVLEDLERSILEADDKIKAVLTIAYDHDEDLKKRIISHVESVLQNKIEVEVKIDPDIVGGFIVETATTHIDGSIKNNLMKLVEISEKQI